ASRLLSNERENEPWGGFTAGMRNHGRQGSMSHRYMKNGMNPDFCALDGPDVAGAPITATENTTHPQATLAVTVGRSVAPSLSATATAPLNVAAMLADTVARLFHGLLGIVNVIAPLDTSLPQQ